MPTRVLSASQFSKGGGRCGQRSREILSCRLYVFFDRLGKMWHCSGVTCANRSMENTTCVRSLAHCQTLASCFDATDPRLIEHSLHEHAEGQLAARACGRRRRGNHQASAGKSQGQMSAWAANACSPVPPLQEYYADYWALDRYLVSLELEQNAACLMPQSWESQVRVV